MNETERDSQLVERMRRYDRWIEEGKIPSSSKVIPVMQSIEFLQWVLPTQQAVEILRNSRSFGLADCLCRTQHRRCDNPLEVCFYTNDVADTKIKQGTARRVSLEDASAALKLANEHGLVHLSIYTPAQHLFALCSCCQCCCHDIEFMKKLDRPDLIARADYVAAVDGESCVQCGECSRRCVFGAQSAEQGGVVFHQERCYGCGLCVSVCPSHSIRMKLRRNG